MHPLTTLLAQSLAAVSYPQKEARGPEQSPAQAALPSEHRRMRAGGTCVAAPRCLRMSQHPAPAHAQAPSSPGSAPTSFLTRSPVQTQPWLPPLQRLPWGHSGAPTSFGVTDASAHRSTLGCERSLCFRSHEEHPPGTNPSSTIWGSAPQGRLLNLSTPHSVKGQG